MGRRKIEIKAIKDDRNRSVTFLKRKGGLFKKAHELSVLCSVDVAVIIFGHNKKLYEYSSSDIQEIIGRHHYHDGPHERKGPADFAGKAGDGDEDDDEDNADAGSASPPTRQEPRPVPQYRQSFVGVRHATPSTSPPMAPNGTFLRHTTPQPLSRPASSNQGRRPSQLVPPDHQQIAHADSRGVQLGYVHNGSGQIQSVDGMPPISRTPGYHASQQLTYPPPHARQHMQEDHRRQSLPPAFAREPRSLPPSFPQQDRGSHQHPHQLSNTSTPQPQQQAFHTPPQPRQSFRAPPQSLQAYQSPPQPARPFQSPPHQQEHHFQSPPVSDEKPQTAASRFQSIFTPIDDSKSFLAAQWGSSSAQRPPKVEAPVKGEAEEAFTRSADISTSKLDTSPQPHQQRPLGPPIIRRPQRPASTSFTANTQNERTSRTSSLKSGMGRPSLKVQIPSEQSDPGSATGESSPKDAVQPRTTTPTAQVKPEPSHPGSVVLPPPSPSTKTILSAGATGPPNPFARPHPPGTQPSGRETYRDLDTPMSALPSRILGNDILPSPGSIFAEWAAGGGRGGGGDWNTLPSPFPSLQTPVNANGPSWKDGEEGERERKRRTEESADGGSGEVKRPRNNG